MLPPVCVRPDRGAVDRELTLQAAAPSASALMTGKGLPGVLLCEQRPAGAFTNLSASRHQNGSSTSQPCSHRDDGVADDDANPKRAMSV